MIVATQDWRRLICECAPDLHHWEPRWMEMDWVRTLAQDRMLLLTDQAGSYALLERHSPDTVEGHIIIADRHRGAVGLHIAGEMLEWIDRNIEFEKLTAKTLARATGIWLRRLGFHHEKNADGYDYFSRPRIRRR